MSIQAMRVRMLNRGTGMYVQYGCGWSSVHGWRNFDASPTLRFERLPLLGQLYTKNAKRFPENVEYGDIVRGLPVAENSCDGVYCSHILEHLSLTDCRAALRNTRVILKPGGVFRLVLPDLRSIVDRYMASDSPDAAIDFIRDTGMGSENRPRGLRGLARIWLGNGAHLWLWDFPSMSKELAAAGFQDIRRAQFNDSVDARFAEVEEARRWEGCLGIECRK